MAYQFGNMPIYEELKRGYRGLKHYWGAPARYQKKRKRRTYGGRYRGGGYDPAKEMKFFDTALTPTNFISGGSIVLSSLNLIPQGAGESQRIGRKCDIKSISMRYAIRFLPSTVAADTIVRVIVYQDKQANGAAATVAGIIEDADFQSFRNLAEKGRFRTLMDKTVAVNATAAASVATPNNEIFAHSYQYQFHKKCHIPIEFNLGAGALTEIRSNNLGILIIGRDTDLANFECIVRVRFQG